MKMIGSFNDNINRSKNGFRFDEETKLFSAYVRMLSGRQAYETLKKNAVRSIPTIRSTDRYIASTKADVKEGVLRITELKEYLGNLNLPNYVYLSMDGTRNIGRAQYHHASNQIVGPVLPLNQETGMPIAGYYQARSASHIEKCFYDVRTKKERGIACNVNVIMAQPPVRGIPAFCLLLYGTNEKYTAVQVSKMWNHIVGELQKVGIKVLTMSSDSAAKFNSVMVNHLNFGSLGDNLSDYPYYFNANIVHMGYIPFQDPIHIAVKFRNRWLNKDELAFGNFKISVNHLGQLLRKFHKDKHYLNEAIIYPTDRQNFDSVLAISDEKVIDLLRSSVKNSDGSVLYLKIMRCFLRSSFDLSLTTLERVRSIWFCAFILRIWKAFIKKHRTYTVEKNFISLPCFKCVEINAHSLIYLLIFLREHDLDDLFIPEMIGSQQCESIFRQLRSFTSTYSTVTNFSVLEMIQRISKVELQNDIIHFKLKHFNFPRTGLPSSSYFPCEHTNNREDKLPSKDLILKQIEMAKLEAIEYAESLGVKVDVSKDLVSDVKFTEATETEQHDDETETDTFESSEDLDVLKLFSDLTLKEYSEKLDPHKIDEKSMYVKVKDNKGNILCLKKHDMSFVLSKTTSKLSSDRLRRVMSKKSD